MGLGLMNRNSFSSPKKRSTQSMYAVYVCVCGYVRTVVVMAVLMRRLSVSAHLDDTQTSLQSVSHTLARLFVLHADDRLPDVGGREDALALRDDAQQLQAQELLDVVQAQALLLLRAARVVPAGIYKKIEGRNVPVACVYQSVR